MGSSYLRSRPVTQGWRQPSQEPYWGSGRWEEVEEVRIGVGGGKALWRFHKLSLTLVLTLSTIFLGGGSGLPHQQNISRGSTFLPTSYGWTLPKSVRDSPQTVFRVSCFCSCRASQCSLKSVCVERVVSGPQDWPVRKGQETRRRPQGGRCCWGHRYGEILLVWLSDGGGVPAN